MKNSELVMGISTHHLFNDPDFYFSGFLRTNSVTLRHWRKIKRHAAFRYRGHCENDPEFKQIIPYCIITTGDKIFAYRRLEGSGESRLHNQFSIGVGGHINPLPGTTDVYDIVMQNMLREIAEEVKISGLDSNSYSKTPLDFADLIGMINWDKEKVGSVHLGLIHRVDLPAGCNVEVRETNKLQGGLYSISELAQQPEWETWSRLVLENLPFEERSVL